MKLKKLTLENFKGFRTQCEIEFGSITLLTGANSSGKSSIIYGVLGAMQSGEFPFQFSTNGKYVNMGDFEDVVYNHLVENEIKIGMEFDDIVEELRVETSWRKDPKTGLPFLNRIVSEKLAHIENCFKVFEEMINFIGSFRLSPERGYFETTKNELKVGVDGRGYLDQIVSWELKNTEKFNELINALIDLELLSNAKTHRPGGGRFDLRVQTKPDGVFTSLYDVGFGVSQFLPILVADLQLPNGSTLFMAQPEIHLHPSVQSNFGDYLVKQVHEKDKRYVIETHSEYLINKLRLAIVKGEIPEDEVKVIFVDNEGEENKVHRIQFTRQGQILNAPDNFFKTYMMDVMDIAINAVEQE